MNLTWNWNIVLVVAAFSKDFGVGTKLERKQDYFDTESFDSKRDYNLNQIGKRGFTSTLGYDYSTSSEYGIGGTSVVTPDYNNFRSGSSAGALSPARDLIPPAVRANAYSSSTSPPTVKSEYPKYDRASSPSTSKDFHSQYRNQISRKSPSHHNHQHHQSSNHYLDEEINTAAATNRGGNFGLVADSDGKLIGYRGSIMPGYTESISTSSVSPHQSNFVGGYYSGTDYPKSKFGSASSASSGSYSSTPVYYPGREEDHTYRMRDTTSQGYEDEDDTSSAEDSDFTVGSNQYQPSPLPPPPHPYNSKESERLIGHNHLDRYITYSNEHPTSRGGFMYGHGPAGRNLRSSSYDFNKRRSYGSHNIPSNFENHGVSTIERAPPYSYSGLGYSDFGSS